MKALLSKSSLIRILSLASIWLLPLISARSQPTATWNNGGGDGLWNTAANWDIGVPAEGTNALITAGNTVNYSAPMAATAFGGFTNLGSTVNINASGFVIGGSGNQAGFVSSSTGTKFYINNGGVVSIPGGGLTFTTNGAGALFPGGSFTCSGTLIVGSGGSSGGGGGQGFFTNNGAPLTTGGLTVNGNSGNPQDCVCYILGGTNQFGAVSIGRSSAGSGGFVAFGREGLIVSNGVVTMTSLDVGASGGNSFLSAYVGNGNVTNTGTMIVRQGSASRSSRFLQTGGVFQSGTVNLRGHTANNVIVIYSISGGTNLIDGIILGNSGGGDTTGTVRLTNAAKIYIGASGISSVGTLNTKTLALNTGGSFGANADWSGTEPILLAGGAFDAGDLSGTAHNISLSGVLSGAGALNKNGLGTLTLNAVETYTGNTLVNQGTLALGAAATISGTPQIIVASGAVLDVSAVTGYTLGATRTLGGSGTVTGDVAVASSGIVSPGTSPGTLTLASSLTVTGGMVLHFDLPTSPGPGNDLLIVSNNINSSGTNTFEIVGGGSPGTVHTLIVYGGAFNGGISNFVISGTTGVLSNNPSAKTISLIVQSSIRSPGNVVWVGNASVNDWDTVNRTNWQNSGTGLLDYFVTGDNALFNNAGTAHSIVNLVGNNAPASLTVGASGNYTFGGSGAISGSGALLKTNTGTLSITNVNTFSGGVTIQGGVLEASVLDIAGSPSSIGSAGADPTKLVVDGATLRYLGSSVTIDRPATLGTVATVDIPSAGTTLTVNGAIGGGGLIKTGPGLLALGLANSYTNGTIINNGTLQFANNAAGGTAGITNNASAILIQGALTLDNIMDFEGNCALEFNGVGGNNTALRGAWVGGGTVSVYFLSANASQTFTMGGSGAGGGHQWNFSGTVDFGTNTGFLRINNDNSTFNFGSSNATFNVGTGNAALNQRNGGTTTFLGALIGGPNTKLSGRGSTGSSGTTTYAIGGKNLDTTFDGQINNGSGTTAIEKQGTGKLTLTGASIHTGATTVDSGTLQVDGSFSSSAVTVNGGTLSGNGTLGAAAQINPGGTLSPGASIGQMTINNGLYLTSGCTNIMEINAALGTNDSIIGNSIVYYGGTLVVTNLAGTLAAGNSFQLYNFASYSGVFDTIVLPPLSGSLTWNTNTLAIDGTIRVVSPQPSFSSLIVSGSAISISGTNGPALANYYVLVSTNVTLPLSSWTSITTNQFDSFGNFSFNDTIDPTVPQRFYSVQVGSP